MVLVQTGEDFFKPADLALYLADMLFGLPSVHASSEIDLFGGKGRIVEARYAWTRRPKMSGIAHWS
ncbi:hypothetical protein D9M69_543480 [compost metagenome]